MNWEIFVGGWTQNRFGIQAGRSCLVFSGEVEMDRRDEEDGRK